MPDSFASSPAFTRSATAILLVVPAAIVGCNGAAPSDSESSMSTNSVYESEPDNGPSAIPEAHSGTSVPGEGAVTERNSQASEPVPDLSSTPIRRGDRYGQIVLVRRTGFSISGEVWGTQGVSDWDSEGWDALDTKQIETESGAMRAFLNGPNIWLPDEVNGSTPSDTQQTFGRVAVRLVATREINPRQRPESYEARDSERDLTITFREGTDVHELTSPSGSVYVMQSASLAIDPDQTLDTLSGLASRLNLPEGWTFSTRKLTANLVLPPDDRASIIEDDLKNVYQRR